MPATTPLSQLQRSRSKSSWALQQSWLGGCCRAMARICWLVTLPDPARDWMSLISGMQPLQSGKVHVYLHGRRRRCVRHKWSQSWIGAKGAYLKRSATAFSHLFEISCPRASVSPATHSSTGIRIVMQRYTGWGEFFITK